MFLLIDFLVVFLLKMGPLWSWDGMKNYSGNATANKLPAK